MRRREFIAFVGSTAVAWPLMARAQTAGTRPLIVFLNSGRQESNAPNILAFLESMRALGYVEGESFDVTYRFADENNARLSTLARQAVELKPNAIVAGQTSAALAAQKATQSLAIICALLVEPVGMGLVANYAHPGSNVTGTLVAVEELSKKQLEIIVELLPGATTIGLLVNPTNPAMHPQQQEIEAAARTKGIKIIAAEASSEADIEPAFKSLIAPGVQAVIVTLFFNERRRVAELAATFRLPTGHGEKLEVQAGGLVSYGVDVPANYGRAAYFVDRVLKGAKPADLPVEFPTKLEMAVNLKTAKALGLDVPQSLIARADEVIE
jgi:putative tryptophan/tyrosine transport system substrate-binding protein